VVTNADRRTQQGLYARQRLALEVEHAQRGIDVFLSPFDILRGGDGVEISYCTWPEGVGSSLPRADCIAFTGMRGANRWYLIVPWDEALAICSGLLERIPGAEPARFASAGWPNADQLRRLNEVAVVRK
jgi:hypothetical protein